MLCNLELHLVQDIAHESRCILDNPFKTLPYTKEVNYVLCNLNLVNPHRLSHQPLLLSFLKTPIFVSVVLISLLEEKNKKKRKNVSESRSPPKEAITECVHFPWRPLSSSFGQCCCRQGCSTSTNQSGSATAADSCSSSKHSGSTIGIDWVFAKKRYQTNRFGKLNLVLCFIFEWILQTRIWFGLWKYLHSWECS